MHGIIRAAWGGDWSARRVCVTRRVPASNLWREGEGIVAAGLGVGAAIVIFFFGGGEGGKDSGGRGMYGALVLGR
jgi:hypothetical protein